MPHLNYSTLAWGHSLDRISTLQKKAIRCICNTNFLSHTEPLFKILNTLKLKDILRMKALKFYYRYINNQLPLYFNNMFLTQTATHSHNTRYRDVPRSAIPVRSTTQNSVRFYIPNLIKATSSNIVDKISTHSYTGFSNYAKLQFINEYSETCSVVNCYICNRN